MTETPAGELELRSAQVAEINFPKRLIELIVMPYETPAQVGYHDRIITEVCSRGAYDGIERRTGTVKVNENHDMLKPIGRTVALHSSREEGLVAELKITKAPEGERALELADDGLWGASAGFCLRRRRLDDGRLGPVVAGAETWEGRSSRRLNHLWLDHIAMTPIPAYESAQVLAVRHTITEPAEPVSMPNRDRLQVEEFRLLAANIDRRYGLSR